ncbi:hypothetical protein BHYA_0910g00010 [Botrytis hyacinthi]|uniref:Uncharacterized protein n=1 Tax=Botrytis hyacinthi TaxID=278943 RepID=A0A4Z1G372_9HELO|nr:hypothetical protein BHYA_0910g00010 [Botrytis hyacinthi]
MSDQPDGYSDYVIIHIINSTMRAVISIENANIKHGKFHVNGDKDSELSTTDITHMLIPPNSDLDISSCGRSSDLYGTEGSIDLYDGDTKIAKLYWNDPRVGPNDFQIWDYRMGGQYMVTLGVWNREGGSLGRVDLEVVMKG